MAAVELYVSFPFPETLGFDDGYLHGEVVRHLMKLAKYDDARLPASIIAYVPHCRLHAFDDEHTSMGRIMGLPAVESYVKVLDQQFKYSKMLKQVM